MKSAVSLQPGMKHLEGCNMKSLSSSQPRSEHQEGCDIQNVISLQSGMEHQEFCDIKTNIIATQYGVSRGLWYKNCVISSHPYMENQEAVI
ncbi:hypothetical protein TNIN_492811 [Trichonephila inaurata madagascariensis]|uniref:Uncharacterized protein n=1 Tax=Trichonephila inaurata madagascariensis TaxID=2747483 RepID=A0A8X7BV79_9ARAC|nr:hypothetical protein TNIN_492811 [Trichonephila inaurata madagascariensis]